MTKPNLIEIWVKRPDDIKGETEREKYWNELGKKLEVLLGDALVEYDVKDYDGYE